MKLGTAYLLIIVVLSIVIFTGLIFSTIPSSKFEGVNLEMTSISLTYMNETGLYAYYVEIKVTNAQPSIVTLKHLKAVFYGEEREQPWSQYYPISDITLQPRGEKTINFHSGDLTPSNLGISGTTKPGEYLDMAMKRTNLGMQIILEGTASSPSYSGPFNIETKFLTGAKPTAEELRESHYSGPFYYATPLEYFRYQPLQHGVLGTGRFPLLRMFSSPSFNRSTVSETIADARTITVYGDKGPDTYYLMDGEFKFDTYLDGSLGRDGDSVYFYGRMEGYLAANGGYYHVMQPMEVSSDEILDPVEEAKGVIVSQVGEDYFRTYFSDPKVDYLPGSYDETHGVSFTYHISVGNYTTSQEVTLYFDPGWRVTYGAEYIPKPGNLQPFNVTEDHAKEIAIKAGVPTAPYGLEAGIGYSWPNPDSKTDYESKYVWFVSSWIDPPSANPRRNKIAVIDPISGKVYDVLEGGIVNIGSAIA